MSIADLMNSVSSAVSRLWFGHDIRNSLTNNITCLKRSFAHFEVIDIACLRRVAAYSPSIFRFPVPAISTVL